MQGMEEHTTFANGILYQQVIKGREAKGQKYKEKHELEKITLATLGIQKKYTDVGVIA